MSEIKEENKFRIIRYEYEDISDETIEQLLPFLYNNKIVTKRHVQEDSDKSVEYFYLYSDGYLYRKIRKYDMDRKIDMIWFLSKEGENLFNSKRMIAYNREKSINNILDEETV